MKRSPTRIRFWRAAFAVAVRWNAPEPVIAWVEKRYMRLAEERIWQRIQARIRAEGTK